MTDRDPPEPKHHDNVMDTDNDRAGAGGVVGDSPGSPGGTSGTDGTAHDREPISGENP